MYWMVGSTQINLTEKCYIFNYFEIIDKTKISYPYYNSLTKQMVFPVNKELVMRACIYPSEAKFLEFYSLKKRL